jgi:hypothetical protein
MAVQQAVASKSSYGNGVEAEMTEVTWSRKLKWIVIEKLQA